MTRRKPKPTATPRWQHVLTAIGVIAALIQIVGALVMWLADDSPWQPSDMQATLTEVMARNQPLFGTVTVMALTANPPSATATAATPLPAPALAEASNAVFATVDALVATPPP